MLIRGKFLLKMLYFDNGFVTCLYVPFYLFGDACTEYVAISLVQASFLACCSALSICEANACICSLDSSITNKGENCVSNSLQGEK
jgi:hypothetical protein